MCSSFSLCAKMAVYQYQPMRELYLFSPLLVRETDTQEAAKTHHKQLPSCFSQICKAWKNTWKHWKYGTHQRTLRIPIPN